MNYFDRFAQQSNSSSGGPSNVSFSPPQSNGRFSLDGFSDSGKNSIYGNQSQSGGPGSDSGSMNMPSSYPIGIPEPHSFAAHDYFDLNSTDMPPSPAAYSNPYDSSASYNRNAFDDNFGSRRRTGRGGEFALLPPPLTTLTPSSHDSAVRRPHASNFDPRMGYPGIASGSHYHHHPEGLFTINFSLKGASHPGISVAEALNGVRLSQKHVYMVEEITRGMYHKAITLRIKWTGYRTEMYNTPLSADFQGHVDLQSLARRTANEIVDFMEANGICLTPDRVVIHSLEMKGPGIWTPIITTHGPLMYRDFKPFTMLY